MNKDMKCAICGVTNKEKTIRYSSVGKCFVCSKHYGQFYRYGEITDPNPRTTKDRNEFVKRDGYLEMIIRNNVEDIVAVCLIDKNDYEKCRLHKWYLDSHGYVKTRINGHNTYLHNYLIGKPDAGKVIDHINRNKFDNRKENLRVVDICVNNSNRRATHVRQVANGKYCYEFSYCGKRYKKSSFDSAEEAQRALEEKMSELIQSYGNLMNEYKEKKKSLPTGVYVASSNKYYSRWMDNGKIKTSRRYQTPEEAFEERTAALEKIALRKAG